MQIACGDRSRGEMIVVLGNARVSFRDIFKEKWIQQRGMIVVMIESNPDISHNWKLGHSPDFGETKNCAETCVVSLAICENILLGIAPWVAWDA